MRTPRWAPEVPFPPYSYVPGLFPHPASDPRGHRFTVPGRVATVSGVVSAMESEAMLLGADLFNHGFYWEAHECWEQLWEGAGRRGTTADFLKGLIKLAAAGVKARQNSQTGLVRHARRAEQLLRTAAVEPEFETWVNVGELSAAARNIAAEPQRYLTTTTQPVVVVFDFCVRLKRSIE